MQGLFGGIAPFDTAKPVELIKSLLKYSTKKDDLILDFFGGSGSSGEALFELNKEDSGNRKFILVQIPELTDEKSEAYKAGYKKISDITIERNKRVVEKIIADKEAEHPNLFTGSADGSSAMSAEREQNADTQTLLDSNEARATERLKQAADEPSALQLGFKVFQLVKSNFPAPSSNRMRINPTKTISTR